MRHILTTTITALTILLLASCDTPYTEALPELTPPSKPAGGVLSCRVVDQTDYYIDLEADFYLVDGFGSFVNSINASSIGITTIGDRPVDVLDASLSKASSPVEGDFSAFMLFDDSGSISSTDPDDDRVEAGISMVRLLQDDEEISVGKFSGSSFDVLSPFTQDTNLLIPVIEDLVLGENGGTPLFYAAFNLLDTIDRYAAHDNRAMIAFTDGGDTVGGATPEEIIAKAQALDIAVYTIGLGTSTDLSALAQIAYDTGGAVMLADDAIQLIALYTSLAELLRGGEELFKLNVRIAAAGVSPGNNTRLATITLPGGDVVRLQLTFEI
jgi:hypothetical protein